MRLDAGEMGIDPTTLDRVAAAMSRSVITPPEDLDPPEGLWDRIAAEVDAERAHVSAGSNTVTS